MAARAAGALRLRAPGGALHGPDPGPRARRADEHGRGRARRVAAQNRDHGPQGQQRRGAGRQRQRLRHGGARRARACVRAGRRDDNGADTALAHARVRLHRRRRVRRTRGGAFRRKLSVPRRRRRRDQPRRDRGLRGTSAPDRRRHGALARRCAGAHGRGPGTGAIRTRAAARAGAAATARPRLPVHARRAGPVRRPRRPRADAHDGPRWAFAGLRRHPAEQRPPGRVGSGDPEPRRLARRRARADARDDELPLSRLAHRPRLGDRARAADRAAAVRDRRRRPLRPLSPPQNRARARGPKPAQPSPLLGLRRAPARRCRAARGLSGG